MQRRFGFALKPGFVGYFLCLNSIFRFWVLPRIQECTVLPLFAILNRFRSHMRAADEAAVALNSCHCTSAPAVHSGSSRNKDIHCLQVFVTYLPTMASHCIP